VNEQLEYYMKICEIFTSIQGESSFAGLPCTFVRLSGCNLRCVYCDTQYAYDEGYDISLDELVAQVHHAGVDLIEITGGEPLLQVRDVQDLMNRLTDDSYTVLIETNGSLSIKGLDDRFIVILDIKTPGSGMNHQMDFSNLQHLKPQDEVKFVVCSREDYEWSKKIVSEYHLIKTSRVLFSPAFGTVKPDELADWILADRLPVRLNLQLHKYIFKQERQI
jgi:7-carboxy-7-deazaguanine synthase